MQILLIQELIYIIENNVYNLYIGLYKSVSTSFNRILEEQADLTHNENLKGLSL